MSFGIQDDSATSTDAKKIGRYALLSHFDIAELTFRDQAPILPLKEATYSLMPHLGMGGDANAHHFRPSSPRASQLQGKPNEGSQKTTTNHVQVRADAKALLEKSFYIDVLKYSNPDVGDVEENHGLTKKEVEYLCKLNNNGEEADGANNEVNRTVRARSKSFNDDVPPTLDELLEEIEECFKDCAPIQLADETHHTQAGLEAGHTANCSERPAPYDIPLPTTETEDLPESYRKDSGVVMEQVFAEESLRKSPSTSALSYQPQFAMNNNSSSFALNGPTSVENARSTQSSADDPMNATLNPMYNDMGHMTAEGMVRHFGLVADTKVVYAWAYQAGREDAWLDHLMAMTPIISPDGTTTLQTEQRPNVDYTSGSQGHAVTPIQSLSVADQTTGTAAMDQSEEAMNVASEVPQQQNFVFNTEEDRYLANSRDATHYGDHDFEKRVPMSTYMEVNETQTALGHSPFPKGSIAASQSASVAPLRFMNEESMVPDAEIAPFEGLGSFVPTLPSQPDFNLKKPKSTKKIFQSPKLNSSPQRSNTSSGRLSLLPRVHSPDAENTIIDTSPRFGKKTGINEGSNDAWKELESIAVTSSDVSKEADTTASKNSAKASKRRVIATKSPRVVPEKPNLASAALPAKPGSGVFGTAFSKIVETTRSTLGTYLSRAEDADKTKSRTSSVAPTSTLQTKTVELRVVEPKDGEPVSPITPRKRRAPLEIEAQCAKVDSAFTTPTKAPSTVHAVDSPAAGDISVSVPKLAPPPKKKAKNSGTPVKTTGDVGVPVPKLAAPPPKKKAKSSGTDVHITGEDHGSPKAVRRSKRTSGGSAA